MFRANFAYLQERKTEVFYNIWCSECPVKMDIPLVWVGCSNPSTPAVDSRKALQYPRLHIQFYKFLMMGGKIARNM